MWQSIKHRLYDLWVTSYTQIWGELKLIGGVCMASGAYIGNIYNDPNVHAAVDRLNWPVELGLGLAVLGAITLVMKSHDA